MQITTVATSRPDCLRHSEGDSIQLSDGRILLLYMEFAGNGSDHAPTRIVAVESRDGGISWGAHRAVTETAPGDVNVYSPNLVRATNGDILLIFMRQQSTKPYVSSQHLWRSSDEGKTWSEANVFGADRNYGVCNAVIKRLAIGRLLLSARVIVQPDDTSHGSPRAAVTLRSDDDGQTWTESTNRVDLPMRGAMEPHVAETRDGRVLMAMRCQLGSVMMAESADAGVTWSTAQTTGLRSPESCPDLLRIPATGDLLMIWNNAPYNPGYTSHYGKRTPLTAAVSRDEGRTWGPPRDIETDPDRAFSNPGCRFMADGTAILNYWTCEYTAAGKMQSVIDLRVAVIPTDWFYGD